jgi:UDP-3-O-[3-hydroxymyristoyl] glucosamine N-acyltransferase
VGIADHCAIEDGAIVGAQAGIPTGKKIRSGQIVWGTPARPLDRFKEQYAWLARLPDIGKRLRKME